MVTTPAVCREYSPSWRAKWPSKCSPCGRTARWYEFSGLKSSLEDVNTSQGLVYVVWEQPDAYIAYQTVKWPFWSRFRACIIDKSHYNLRILIFLRYTVLHSLWCVFTASPTSTRRFLLEKICFSPENPIGCAPNDSEISRTDSHIQIYCIRARNRALKSVHRLRDASPWADFCTGPAGGVRTREGKAAV